MPEDAVRGLGIASILTAARAPARIVGFPKAYLAATLATAFRGQAVDKLASGLHEAALNLKNDLALDGTLPLSSRQAIIAEAERLRAVIKTLPEPDRVPVMAVVVRELLVDTTPAAERLDLMVRDACERRYHPTPAHNTRASEILDSIHLP